MAPNEDQRSISVVACSVVRTWGGGARPKHSAQRRGNHSPSAAVHKSGTGSAGCRCIEQPRTFFSILYFFLSVTRLLCFFGRTMVAVRSAVGTRAYCKVAQALSVRG